MREITVVNCRMVPAGLVTMMAMADGVKQGMMPHAGSVRKQSGDIKKRKNNTRKTGSSLTGVFSLFYQRGCDTVLA
jgi:hypothetical protein